MVHAELSLREAPSEKRAWSETHKVSLMHNSIETLPSNIGNGPNLTTLLLPYNRFSEDTLNFQCFQALKYLEVSSNSLTSFTKEICMLEKLEYLNLSSNHGICSLPEEINALVELKYLLLRDCSISEVPEGIFSKLVKLLMLDIHSSFANVTPQSMIIEQLDCLDGRLKALGINATTQSDLDKLARLSGIPITTLRTNELTFLPPFLSNMIRSKHISSNLKNLIISRCTGGSLHEDLVVDYSCCLVNLEMLTLTELNGSLMNKIIWKGVRPQDLLSRLRKLEIIGCPELKHATWTWNLPCLENLLFWWCDNIRTVVSEGEGKEIQEKDKPAASPSLRVLRLSRLPMLGRICDFDVTLPSLELLYVVECPQLKKLPFSSTTSCSRLKKIYGAKEWWESLDMEDNIRTSLLPFFEST